VARMYAELVGTLVIDRADEALADDVEAVGLRCVVTPTIMHTVHDAERLSATVLDAVSGLRA
jgi:LPPG:FO 2-phospho-L-lactate transferase